MPPHPILCYLAHTMLCHPSKTHPPKKKETMLTNTIPAPNEECHFASRRPRLNFPMMVRAGRNEQIYLSLPRPKPTKPCARKHETNRPSTPLPLPSPKTPKHAKPNQSAHSSRKATSHPSRRDSHFPPPKSEEQTPQLLSIATDNTPSSPQTCYSAHSTGRRHCG